MKTLRLCLSLLTTFVLFAGTAFAQSADFSGQGSAAQGTLSGSGKMCCPVPEPPMLWLLLLGFVGVVVAVAVKKRRSRKGARQPSFKG